MGRPRKLSPDREAQIRRLLALKVPTGKLARKFGVGTKTILRCDPKRRAKYVEDMREFRRIGPKNKQHQERKCIVCRKMFLAHPRGKICSEKCRKFRQACRAVVRRIASSKR
jgi:hypothetical protein